LLDAGGGASVETMSYVHCGGCQCAFDATAHRRCPRCGHKVGAGGPLTVEDEIADATAQLARALARATAAQLDALIAQAGSPARDAAAPSDPARDAAQWAEAVLGAVGSAVADARGVALAVIDPPPAPREPEPPRDVGALLAALLLAVGAHARAMTTAMIQGRALPVSRLPERSTIRRRATELAKRARRALTR